MYFPWFKRIGIMFVPKTPVGTMIFLAAIVYSVYAFLDIDSRSHSVSDTMINFVFVLLIIAAVYTLLAYLTSRKSEP